MLKIKAEENFFFFFEIFHNNYKSKYSSYKKFIDFIDKIRKLYQTFSENIEQIFSKNFSFKENQPNLLQPLLISLENHIKLQASEFHRLSKYIKTEIIETYKLLKDFNDKIEEKINKELLELNKTFKKSKIKLDENRNLYNSKMKNLEKIILEEKSMKINILTGNNEIKEKKKAIDELLNECKSEENKYEKILEEVNNNIDKVKEKENLVINFYRNCEQNRISKMKENINVLINTLKETCGKLNNDIVNMIKQENSIEKEEKINSFEKLVESNYKPEKNFEFIPYKPFSKLDDSLKITTKKSETETSIKFEIISIFQNNFKNISKEIDIPEEKRRYELRNLCFRLFDKDQNINFVKEDLDNLLSFIKEENYRIYFLNYLSKERTDGKLSRSEKIIKELSIILKQILFLAEKEKNFDNAKKCVILSQTFFVEKKIIKEDNTYKNKKIYLMEFLKDNEWIHSINFWQEMLEYEINNNMKKLLEENLNKDKTKLEGILQNTYFSTIITYANNMAIFNIEKKLTIELCDNIIRKYKISEDLINMLIKSVEDAYNPNKKNNLDIKKELDNKKKTKSVALNSNIIEPNKKNIEDDWVIYNEDKNNKKDNIIDDFVIEGNNNINNNIINDNLINKDNNINIIEEKEDIYKNEIKDENNNNE